MIPRILEKDFLRLAQAFPAVALLGPRQSGKTTLAKLCFADYLYCSLENPDVREFAQNDTRRFLDQRKKYPGMIIDEAQNVPELFSYLQEILDNSEEMGKFILTGSQNFLLTEKITQSLAGRIAILTLLPFSMREVPIMDLDMTILHGYYPRVITGKISAQDWYPQYIQTYLERDVRKIINIENLNTFQRFLRLCAGRVGQTINYSDLSRDVGVSSVTIKKWFSVLEASYICFFLPPFYKNLSKRVVKSPKLYFYDTGIACALLSIHSDTVLSSHPLRGALFENLIISEIYKNYCNQSSKADLYFYRDNIGNEVDCLLEKNGQPHCIEIKSAQTINPSFFKGLKHLQKSMNVSPEHCHLIYGGKQNFVRSSANVYSWEKTFLKILQD